MSSRKPPELLEPSEGQKDKTICKLCRRQFAKYTCPTCNIPYCCLVCFRSPAHNRCSESFYKKEVDLDIRAGPSKSTSERLKMLDLLRKFEEENANDLFLDGEDSDDDGDHPDVAQRFAGLNLDSLSSDAIWSMLTPEERKNFTKAMENPESQLAQELLTSEQLEKDIDEPWWDGFLDSPSSHRPVSKPEMLQLPSSLLKAPPSPYLLYNTCAICVVYAFVTRHLGASPLCKLELGSPEYREGRKLFARLTPFATNRKSAKIYENLSDLTTDLWSRFNLDEMTNQLYSLLLQDAAALLTSFRVTEVTSTPAAEDFPDLSSHAHKMPLLVLSDLHTFYSKGAAGNSNHIARKLLFYAAHIATIPTLFLEALSKETLIRAKQYEGRLG